MEGTAMSDDAESGTESKKKRAPQGGKVGIGLVLGIAVGAAMGSATGDMGMWVGVGVALGLVLGAAAERRG
jgi:hypothetical protein